VGGGGIYPQEDHPQGITCGKINLDCLNPEPNRSHDRLFEKFAVRANPLRLSKSKASAVPFPVLSPRKAGRARKQAKRSRAPTKEKCTNIARLANNFCGTKLARQ
jgi:hypothetical protein